jgi:hypothetical protein
MTSLEKSIKSQALRMTILWENRTRNSGRERRVCEKFRLAGLIKKDDVRFPGPGSQLSLEGL